MADDGSQQRKPNLRTAVEDGKALATVLVMKLESVLGRRLSFRSPAVLAAIGVITTLVLALVVVMALLQTGNAKAVSDNAALIGALVALGGVFTAQMVRIALDDRRSHEARDLEAQRAGEAALQNYFEAVGELLIEKPLLRASPGDDLSTVVRAQTLSVLEGLDPDRKRILLLFLYESGVIHQDKPVVSLEAANLRDANLSKAYLQGANLRGTILRGADLRGADLRGADLYEADLSRADLRESYLPRGRALGAAKDLSEANLSEVTLTGAELMTAQLSKADLSGAWLYEADLAYAFLSEADLSRANLKKADLTEAVLYKADLREASMLEAWMEEADLRDADLQDADLTGASGWSEEQFAEAKSLEGATMPDGQILRGDKMPNGPTFEEWLKDREQRGEDG